MKLLRVNLEWRAWNMIVAPLDNQDVVASLAYKILDVEVVVSLVLDRHFVTGSFGPVQANVDDVVAFYPKKEILADQFHST